MTPQQVLWTTSEVADLCRVSASTVLRWIRSGLLPAIELPGGGLRITDAALTALLAKQAKTDTAVSA